jgi:hypothetical protein
MAQASLPSPPGRAAESLPNVTLVILDVVPPQECQKFLLKGPLPVVLFLFGDVLHHLRSLRASQAEIVGG